MRLLLFALAAVLCRAQGDYCAIEGQVFNHATGEPIKKVQLLVRGMGSSADAPYGAVTDASGRFSIRGIKPGRYVLSAERAGFVRAEYTRGAGRRATIVDLQPGQQLKDVVFRMRPHAVITGRVLDEEGDPVAGVQVQPMRFGYAQGKRTLLPAGSATTNDIGEYRLAGLSAGKYYLAASFRAQPLAGGEATEERYAPVYYPGTADPGAAAPVEVIPGSQMRGVDIGLTRTRTVRVTGWVTNAGSAGGSHNVMIFLMRREGGMRGYNSGNSIVVREGKFEIRGVVPGSYLIVAHWYEDGKRSVASQPVQVGESGLQNVALTMSPPFDVPGRITVEGTPDTSFTRTQVVLVPENEIAFGGPGGGRVEPDGAFVLTNASPDLYRVQVSGLPADCYLKSARLGDNEMIENGANLTAGSGPLEITLSAAGGQISGAAIDSGGQPLGGATVVLVPDERRRRRADLYRVTTSDEQGRYTLRGVAPGDYKLYAWESVDAGAWEDPEFLKQYDKSAESVSMEEKAHRTVALKAQAAEAR